MKTVEFKLALSRSQQQTIDEWLSASKYVWNKGVELIKRFNDFNRYDKRFKATFPCCPIAAYNPKLHRRFPACPIGWELDDYSGLSCDREDKQQLTQSLIDEGKVIENAVTSKHPCGLFPVRPFRGGKLVKNVSDFELLTAFAHKRNRDKPWLTAMDSKFVAGIVNALAKSWEAFLKGQEKPPKRKPPKFKKRNERIDTLINNNTRPDPKTGRPIIPIEGDRLRLPKIGWVRAKGLSDRWPLGTEFGSLKICRKASGYYLQLSGDIVDKSLKPAKVKAVGLDPGIRFVYSDDAGRQVKVPSYLERDLQKLKRLQRKAQKQWDMNHDMDASDQIGWHPPLADGPWQKKNWRKTQNKIAKLHEKIARRGRAFNHFQSTKLVRQFEQIFLEDYRVSEIVGKVEPVDSGKLTVNINDELTTIYEQNGRNLNRATNRAALRNRVGQLWTMIETKGGRRRLVRKVERSGTSDECPKCGNVEEKTLKVRTHRCKACGFVAPRDVAAAQVIKKRGLLIETGETQKTESQAQEKRRKRGRKKGNDEGQAAKS